MFKTCGVLSMDVNRYLYGVMVFLQVLLKANVRKISVVKVTVIVMIPCIGKDARKRRVLHLKRVNRVEELVTKLRQKHGSRYNTIQYRIWAEIADIGSHE